MSTRWYYKSGENTDVAVSTRIRLARNLVGYPFPQRMTEEQKTELSEKVSEALKGADEKYLTVRMDDISDTQALAMVERHLISPEFAKNRNGRTLILTEDESVSIMLCEEDHIRIQVMASGTATASALEKAQKIDEMINAKLTYAFDEKLGFLTACPTNLGTGLRASVMLHLPALHISGKLSNLTQAVSKIGLTLRGAYGENSKADTEMYQLSNQITLGISEDSAVQNLTAIAMQVIENERTARKELDPLDLEDKSMRAVSTLRSARLMSSTELASLASLVRMGIGENIVTDVTNESLTGIIFDTKRANITLIDKGAKDARSRDYTRAKFIRERL